MSVWNASVPSVGGISIAQATKDREAIKAVITNIQTSLSNGSFDGVFDWGATLDWDNFNRNGVEQINIITTLISQIQTNPYISSVVKDPLIKTTDGVLPKLQTYIGGKNALADLE
jgi:hypothetical protein